MTQKDMMNIGMALAGCFVAYKFGPNQAIKAGAIAVAAVIVAKRVPVLSTVL